jgi:MotA/TolQ/ExbB proton channel family
MGVSADHIRTLFSRVDNLRYSGGGHFRTSEKICLPVSGLRPHARLRIQPGWLRRPEYVVGAWNPLLPKGGIMARPLEKTANGKLYTRPPEIEAATDAALAQDLGTHLRRALIRDPNDPEYLPSECLLYLIREARRRRDDAARQVNSQTGQQETVALRATVPADTFFNPQAIVDNRLRTEFFKHLPGICTGLGIIGTFLGLIQGLSAFKVSENAQEVGKSIDALLHGVFEAFLVSAAAIAIAMAITLIEKFLISSLYRRTEAIAHRLDGMFEAGADSEYLERLVRSSEESASQAKILKDALVADLKTILSDLTQQQIQASRAVSTQIADSLRASFTEPLAQIASAVQQVSQDQGQAVTRLLTDVLANFSQQIQDLFSGQISGINQLQRQAIESLQATVTKLDQMVGGIDVASQRATEAMAAKMRDAIDAMESRLATINERSTALVEQMGSTTTDAIDKMTAGAASLYAAVGEFTKATQDVTAVMSGTSGSPRPREARTTALDARRMSLLFTFDFQKRSAAPTSKNQPERARCCLIFASRVRAEPDRGSCHTSRNGRPRRRPSTLRNGRRRVSSSLSVRQTGQFGQLRGGGELTIKPDLGRLQQ